MKLFAKIAAGFLVLVLLLCVLGGVFFVRSGAFKHAKGFSDGIFGIVNSASAIEKANEARPFTPPEDGVFTEAQMRGYIDVCSRMKPVVGPYEEWMRAHENESGDFKDASEVVKMTSGLMAEMAKALEANSMSPREYAWLDREVRRSLDEVSEKRGGELNGEILAYLEELAARPDTSPEARAEIAKKIAEFGRRSKGEDGEPLTPNGEMCLKHYNELKECEMGDLGRSMLQGFANSPKKRRAHRPG